MSNRRSPIENEARSRCRSLVHSYGSRVDKIDGTHIRIPPCEKWPDGLITEFHGWMDLLLRLRACELDPSILVTGIYFRRTEPQEMISCQRVQESLQRQEA